MNETLPPTLRGWPVDHLGIAVKNLEEATEPYRLLELPVLGDEEVASQGVRIRALAAGGVLLELLEPTTPESPIARFIEKRGPGLHHLALRVDSLPREIERLQNEGARFVSSEPRPGRAGSRVVFLHPAWSGGVLLELVDHP